MKNKNIWVEKYRPQKLDSIVQQNEIKTLLKYAFETKTLTHMLLYGPSGSGKTTIALTISKTFFQLKDDAKKTNKILNEKILRERVLELNASDERGIKIVRDKIKNFAISSINDYENIPKFKIIILDEADAMTSDSQFALRRIIEKYTETTRFILICNYVTKIILPLASRCMKIRFQSISTNSLEQIINKIALNEKIDISKEFIIRLNEITKGDLRKSINLLERTYFLDNNLSIDILNEVSGQLKNDLLLEIWNILIDKKTSIIQILSLINKFKNLSYSSVNLLDNLFNLIIKSKISDKKKSIILIEMSKIDYYLNDNANEFIQLIKLFELINSIY
jgi:replication factor C subunit 2/4